MSLSKEELSVVRDCIEMAKTLTGMLKQFGLTLPTKQQLAVVAVEAKIEDLIAETAKAEEEAARKLKPEENK